MPSQFRKRTEKPRPMTLITPEEALALVQSYFQSSVAVLTKKTLYNKVSAGVLSRHGPRHRLLLDRDEVWIKLCRHYRR